MEVSPHVTYSSKAVCINSYCAYKAQVDNYIL